MQACSLWSCCRNGIPRSLWRIPLMGRKMAMQKHGPPPIQTRLISPQSWRRVRKLRAQQVQHPWRPQREAQETNLQMEERIRIMPVPGLQAVMRLNHSFRATLRRVYPTERVTTKLPPREYLCSVRDRKSVV